MNTKGKGDAVEEVLRRSCCCRGVAMLRRCCERSCCRGAVKGAVAEVML